MIEPVYATKFLTKIPPSERHKYINAGIYPVNDIFINNGFINAPEKLLFPYGSWGSGKTKFVLGELCRKAISNEYFAGYYGRAVLEDVRKLHGTLCSVIKENGWKRLFKFSEEPNGSMIVTCKRTGHRLYPFGCADTESMKGLDDATDIFVDEIDSINFYDFGLLLGRLRTIKASTHLWGCFNTEKVFADHWLRTEFFSDKPTPNVKKLLVNYPDNAFLNHEQYAADLWIACGGNVNLFNAITKGEWGVQENGNPWLHACNPTKHFKDVPFLPSYPIYISFDFNNDPFACTIRQSSPHMGGSSSFIHYIDEIVGQLKVEDTCQIIKARYPSSIIYITGDRSGSNEDLGRNQTLYQIIAGLLNLNESQINTNTANLLHSDSRLLLNAMFQHYPNLYIDSKCKQLRIDCQKAAVDGESKLPSHLKKDREGFKMDVFDAMRYDFQTYFNKWAKETYFKVLKIK